MSAGFLTSLPLWLSGTSPAGESEGRVGNAEPTNSTAGEQLQGIGTLAQPVRQEITGQLNCLVVYFRGPPWHFASNIVFPLNLEEAEEFRFQESVLKKILLRSRKTLAPLTLV